MPPSKERVHNAMHMLVGWLVGPSVTFSFSINNTKMAGVTGSKVKVSRVKCAKTVSYQ